MKLAVLANDALFFEWNQRPLPETVEQHYYQNFETFIQAEAHVFIDLLFEPDQHRIQQLAALKKPVIINSVIHTIQEMEPDAHPFFLRTNAWPGFIKSKTIEIASASLSTQWMDDIFEQLQWNAIRVPDTVGMVSARIVAMIINEAWFTLGEGVANMNDIDLAMQQGTNYPYGPFKWSEMIGYKNILDLLLQLSKEDIKYMPAAHLVQAAAV